MLTTFLRRAGVEYSVTNCSWGLLRVITSADQKLTSKVYKELISPIDRPYFAVNSAGNVVIRLTSMEILLDDESNFISATKPLVEKYGKIVVRPYNYVKDAADNDFIAAFGEVACYLPINSFNYVHQINGQPLQYYKNNIVILPIYNIGPIKFTQPRLLVYRETGKISKIGHIHTIGGKYIDRALAINNVFKENRISLVINDIVYFTSYQKGKTSLVDSTGAECYKLTSNIMDIKGVFYIGRAEGNRFVMANGEIIEGKSAIYTKTSTIIDYIGHHGEIYYCPNTFIIVANGMPAQFNFTRNSIYF